MIFRIRGEEIEKAREFRYLARILDENDNDRKFIIAQLKKTRVQWRQMAKILKREGAEPYQMERFM